MSEAEYKERINCLAVSLPNLGTHKTELEVNIIDNDIEEDQNHANNDLALHVTLL